MSKGMNCPNCNAHLTGLESNCPHCRWTTLAGFDEIYPDYAAERAERERVLADIEAAFEAGAAIHG